MDKFKAMKKNLFIWDNAGIVAIGIILIFVGVIIKFKAIIYNIALIIGSYFYIGALLSLINIIIDINKNRVITEKLYIQYIGEENFEMLFKKYYYIRCHKVKGKKYTDKTVYLNASKDFEIQEKTIVEIVYYEKSKIVKEIK